MADLEARLRALSTDALAAVARDVLNDLRTDSPPVTEEEIKAAAVADRETIAAAAKELKLDEASAPSPTYAVEVLAALAHGSPEAASSIEAAVMRLDQPRTKLPIFGLGGLELIVLAIAAAIARPTLKFEHIKETGTTRLKLNFEGTNELSTIIRAVLPSLRNGE